MIDFIIPHMGRPELLQKTIESILDQSKFNLVENIFVVSKNDVPPTVPEHPAIHVHTLPASKTISEQRNFGISLSKAKIIALVDADIELAPDWISVCLSQLESNTNRIGVSAMQKSKYDNKIEKIRTALCYAGENKNLSVMSVVNLMHYRIKSIAVGGFPEHLMTCEDTYYTEKLSSIGELYYTNDTYYYHLGEDHSIRQTFNKEIWRSEFNIKSLKGRTVPIREWPSILFPCWIALNFLAFLLTMTLSIYPSIFLAMMLIPTTLYSIRLKLTRDVDASSFDIFIFYFFYFAARTIGTVKGIRFIFLRKSL